MARQNGPGNVGYAVQTPLWLGGGVYFLLAHGPDSGMFWLGFTWIAGGAVFAVSWFREVRRDRTHRASSSDAEDGPE